MAEPATAPTTKQMLHPKKKGAVLDAFARGASWRGAAKAARRTRMTLWRWARDDPAFAAAIKAARAAADDAVEAVTFELCLDPHPAHDSLRMFWLRRHKPETYRPRPPRGHAGRVAIEHAYAGPTPSLPAGPGPYACKQA